MKSYFLFAALLACIIIPNKLLADEKDEQPPNAIYATIKLYELIEASSANSPDSVLYQKKIELLKLIKQYSGDKKDYLTLISQYGNLYKLATNVLESDTSVEKIIKAYKSLSETHKKLLPGIGGIIAEIDKIETNRKQLTEKVTAIKKHITVLEEREVVDIHVPYINTDAKEQIVIPITSLLQTLQEKAKETVDENAKGLQGIIKLKDSLLNEYKRLKPDKKNLFLRQDRALQKALESRNAFFAEILESNHRISDVTYTQVENIHNLYSSPQGLALKMPSETEAIDAMAIFLAKRVKQEAVLWFFDELKKNARIYEDLDTLFPNCMNLLRSNELYESPDLGKAWRYAIAQDFVSMPQKITKLHYVRSLFKGEKGRQILPYVETGINVAVALQNRYTLNETLDYLYLNKVTTDTSADKLNVNDFVTLLYAVKEEIYVIKGERKQWLAPSAILNMDDEMFITMLSLIDLKYDKVFTKLLSKTNQEFSFNSQRVDDLKVWVANILLNIKKLEAIYYETESLIKEQGTDISEINYNVWAYTNRIINVLQDTTIIKINNKKVLEGLQILSDVISIYEAIDKKDYVSAVDKSFDLAFYFFEQKNHQPVDLEYLSWAYSHTKQIKKYNYKAGLGHWDKDKIDTKKEEVIKSLSAGDICFEESIKSGNLLYKDKKGNCVTYDKKYEKLRSYAAVDITKLSSEITRLNKLYKAKSFTDDEMEGTVKDLRGAFDIPEVNAKLSLKLERIMSRTNGDYTDADFWGLDSMRFVKVQKLVSRTTLFLTEVSDAKNSQDLSSVVEKFALPPASYKIKRASMHSWFINAYVGPYIGYEFLKVPQQFSDTGLPKHNGMVYGLSAPIGITYSFPSRRHKASNKFQQAMNKKGEIIYLGSNPWSITLSVVDIGAVVSYRLGNTTDILPHEFKWEQFVSPGLHVAKSFFNTPLVFSASCVYTPLIRNVKDVDRQYNALRIQAGLFFDIPIYKLGAKGRFANLD